MIFDRSCFCVFFYLDFLIFAVFRLISRLLPAPKVPHNIDYEVEGYAVFRLRSFNVRSAALRLYVNVRSVNAGLNGRCAVSICFLSVAAMPFARLFMARNNPKAVPLRKSREAAYNTENTIAGVAFFYELFIFK